MDGGADNIVDSMWSLEHICIFDMSLVMSRFPVPQTRGNGKSFQRSGMWGWQDYFLVWLNMDADSVCIKYQPQLPPFRWLQPHTAPSQRPLWELVNLLQLYTPTVHHWKQRVSRLLRNYWLLVHLHLNPCPHWSQLFWLCECWFFIPCCSNQVNP